MRKKAELALMLLLLAGLVLAGRRIGQMVSSGRIETNRDVVIIDCGHGGNDPGKVGEGDILEKDINLEIGLLTREQLEKKGYRVIMTRETDDNLAERDDGNKKIQDMKARVKLINDTAPGLTVSIHQNSYHDASVHGAQVFYFTHSAEAKQAAEIMQKALLAADPENTRLAKANDTYYLLKKTEVPAIIVECGFLSSPEEAARLTDEEYQKKLAEAVAAGADEYLSSKTIGK